MVEPLVCVRCGRPVEHNREMLDAFEKMHYVCFHYEYEHDAVDPDLGCEARGCPSSGVGGDFSYP